MDRFSTKLKHRLIILNSATDVVRLSFIVRNSISHLDLRLSQYPSIMNDLAICGCCKWKYSKSFINTEEKCRKLIAKSRRLLYTLHLDLPEGRECSLKGFPSSIDDDFDDWAPHIAKIVLATGFDISTLSNFVEHAMAIRKEKPNILSWILKMTFSGQSWHTALNILNVKEFVVCFHPEITDPVVFKDFIMHFDFEEWICTYQKPEILEYLLYYARHHGREDLNKGDFPIVEMIDLCIAFRFFLNIAPILKYVNAPRFSEDCYRMYFFNVSEKRPNMTKEVLRMAEKRLKRERIHQILQFICIYIKCCENPCIESASEALRLIWNSVPDTFISFEEIKTAFGEVFEAVELKSMYDFYAASVGKFHDSAEPRSLKHLSRTAIRKTLSENQIWIPEGLRLMGIPKLFQSFLNLEKVSIASYKMASRTDFS